MSTTRQVLMAMTSRELSEAAVAAAAGALTAPKGTLHPSLYRQQLAEIESERAARGLWSPADWFEQAARELQFRFPPKKPRKSKPAAHVDLDGASPESIARTAVLLGRAALIATKAGEADTAGILASFAAALDKQLPDQPKRRGRGNPHLN